MLSLKHHACCWALSMIAVFTYHGLASTAGYAVDVSRAAMYTLLPYTIYLILTGPRPRPRWWDFCHWAATACLMVSLGAIADDFCKKREAYSTVYANAVVHAALAFSVVATHEAIRQNRQEYNQAHVLTLLLGGRLLRKPYFSFASFRVFICHQASLLAVFESLLVILNSCLYELNGPGVTCASIWESHMGRGKATPGDAAIFYFVLGSVIDFAETIFVLIHKSVFKAHYPAGEPLSSHSWTPLSLNIVGNVLIWAICLPGGQQVSSRERTVAMVQCLGGQEAEDDGAERLELVLGREHRGVVDDDVFVGITSHLLRVLIAVAVRAWRGGRGLEGVTVLRDDEAKGTLAAESGVAGDDGSGAEFDLAADLVPLATLGAHDFSLLEDAHGCGGGSLPGVDDGVVWCWLRGVGSK
ncbi:hypothetical protein G7046_g5480 [Stylonectria norvegica]|nr:hypothetical protein G7046_g5480 [Stylonectria norvegica]